MITLKGEFIDIKVDTDNPLYEMLQRLEGEIFIVRVGVKDEKKPRVKKDVEKKEPVVFSQPTFGVIVETKQYLLELDKIILDEKSTTKKILQRHAERFFGSPAESERGTYAALESTKGADYLTLARVIDDEVSYLTVKPDLVSSV